MKAGICSAASSELMATEDSSPRFQVAHYKELLSWTRVHTHKTLQC